MAHSLDLSPQLGGYFLQITDTCIIAFNQTKVVYANEASEKLLGPDLSDLLELDVADFIPEEEQQTLVEKLSSVKERTDYFPIHFKNTSNQLIEMKVRLVPLIIQDEKIVMLEGYDISSISELKKKNILLEEQILHLSPLDLETHLPSLILFNDRVEQGILRALREARGNFSQLESFLTVVTCSIEGLAEIQNQYGIDGRKCVLDALISRFRSSIRSVDTLAKAPNDSFCFLFEKIKDRNNVHIITDRLNKCVLTPILYKDHTLNIDVKFGSAIYPDNGNSAVSLIKWARLNSKKISEN